MEYNGCIQLHIKKSSITGKSYPAAQYYKLPLQIMPPSYQDSDGTAFFYLLNPSGGIMEYDRFLIDIKLEDKAKAYITTPSASKIYKQRSNETATQKTMFHIGKDCTLEYCPEETMPYAGSSFHQKNLFYLQENSRLITWDIFCAGRICRKESFQFQDYQSVTGIYVDNQPLILDKTCIMPQTFPVRNSLCMENYDYCATVYAYAPECTLSLVQTLRQLADQYLDGLLGVSLVRKNLIILKITGSHAYLLNEFLHKIWTVLRQQILHKDAVLVRKY